MSLNNYTYTLILILLVSGASYKLLKHSDNNNNPQTPKEKTTEIIAPSSPTKKDPLSQGQPLITQDTTTPILSTSKSSNQNKGLETPPINMRSQETNNKMKVYTQDETEKSIGDQLIEIEPESVGNYESVKLDPSILNADQEYIEKLIIDSNYLNKTRVSDKETETETIPQLTRDQLEELYGIDPNSNNNSKTIINQVEVDSIINADSEYLNSLIKNKTTNHPDEKALTNKDLMILNEAYKDEPLE